MSLLAALFSVSLDAARGRGGRLPRHRRHRVHPACPVRPQVLHHEPDRRREQDQGSAATGGMAVFPLTPRTSAGGREALLKELEVARAAGLPLAVRLLEPELELAGAGPVRLVEEAR